MLTSLPKLLFAASILLVTAPTYAQTAQPKPKPEDTEIWKPEPKVVTPASDGGALGSAAVVLSVEENDGG